MSALRPGNDPNNLTLDQFRASTRMAKEVERYRGFRADMKRLDSAESDTPTEPADWRDGACTCACATKRGADGKLESRGDCSCTRVTEIRADEHGHPKAVIEECKPNEDKGTNMTINHDATDTLPDLVGAARAKRDAETAAAWRSDATTKLDERAPVARRSDAMTKRGKTSGPNRARNDAKARELSISLGMPVTRGDAKRLIRARGGDSDLLALAPDTARALIRQGRSQRDTKRAAIASVAGRRAFGDAEIGAKGRSVNTDANDAGPIDVEAARQARDVRMAHAGQPAVRPADIAGFAPRIDTSDEGADEIEAARARRDAKARDAWKPGAQ